MEASEMRATFERAMGYVEAFKTLDPEAYCSVDIGGGNSHVCMFPSESVKEQVTRTILKSVGKLSKDDNGNLSATRDNMTITLFGVLKCEIVGYKKEKRAKVQVVDGEFEEIETPIYKCLSPVVKVREEIELAEVVTNDN